MTYSNFKHGDIVVVNLPFTDFSDIKKRPAIVVSSNKFNRRSKDVIIAKITGTEFSHGLSIGITNDDLEQGELKKESYIDLSLILTVEKKLMGKPIANVKKNISTEIKGKLSELFDI